MVKNDITQPRSAKEIATEHQAADERMGRDWSGPDGCGCGACNKTRKGNAPMMTNTETQTTEQRIRNEYARMNIPLASRGLFGSPKWDANSQYGYCLSEHDTEAEAEQAVIDYYSERMNLIDQWY